MPTFDARDVASETRVVIKTLVRNYVYLYDPQTPMTTRKLILGTIFSPLAWFFVGVIKGIVLVIGVLGNVILDVSRFVKRFSGDIHDLM